MPYLGGDFHPLDRASFAWRTRCYSDPNTHALGGHRRSRGNRG